LARFFDVTIWKGYDDSTDVRSLSLSPTDQSTHSDSRIPFYQSFFTIYRNLFERLASEENMLDNSVNYPSFGYSTWPWSSEMKKRTDADGAAREFYSVWTNFGTEKDFTWVEQWKLSEAPDRRVRRCVRCLPIHILSFLSCRILTTN
jgi:DnaJ family protein A protein 5